LGEAPEWGCQSSSVDIFGLFKAKEGGNRVCTRLNGIAHRGEKRDRVNPNRPGLNQKVLKDLKTGGHLKLYHGP